MKYLRYLLLIFSFSAFAMENATPPIKIYEKQHYENCLSKVKQWRKKNRDTPKRKALSDLISSCYNRTYEIPSESREILVNNDILQKSEKVAPELLAICVKELREQSSLKKRLVRK